MPGVFNQYFEARGDIESIHLLGDGFGHEDGLTIDRVSRTRAITGVDGFSIEASQKHNPRIGAGGLTELPKLV